MSMLWTILQKINQEIKMINFSKYVLLQKQLEKNSMAIESEPVHSTNEQIKTKLSGIRQYNPINPRNEESCLSLQVKSE